MLAPDTDRKRRQYPLSNRTESSSDTQELLSLIGMRVRGLRARRGMTRRALAEQSAVSERFLAQLEQGEGNISIARLRDIAVALGVDIAELLRDEAAASAEVALIDALVRRMPSDRQQEALGVLRRRFGERPGAEGHIALIGLRGAGKTTLGERLAEALERPFVRLVGEIERLAQMPVSEIFSLSGQQGYRRFEERALMETVGREQPCIIEAGGSIVAEARSFNILIDSCLVIWVKARPEDHMQRVIAQGDTRPMADNPEAMDDLKRILEERESYYAQAHAILDTAGKSVDESLADLRHIVAAQGQNAAEA